MSDYTVKLEGTEELLQNLARINSDIRGTVALQAVGAGAKQIKDRAVINAPVLTGNLRNSGIVHTMNEGDKAVAEISFGGGLRHARIQEFGGTISAKNAKYLRFRYHGKWVMKKSVKIIGKHYLGNAIEQEKGNAVTAMGNVIRAYLGE